MSAQVFNQKAVLDLVEGDLELLAELSALAALESEEKLGLLTRAVKDNDREGIAHHAHTMRSVLANLGAEACCEILRSVEEAGKLGKGKECSELIVKLEQQVEIYFKEVASFRGPS